MVVVLHRAISCCNFTYDRLMRRRCAAFPAGERGDEIVFAYAARGRSLSSSGVSFDADADQQRRIAFYSRTRAIPASLSKSAQAGPQRKVCGDAACP